mmetsp:Transcript_86126/g.184512  ORF Transcript_86126/g.184512 Transcript_86126/m.184512 type:complete len:320 (+) Transcript_86126:933-1892(+)
MSTMLLSAAPEKLPEARAAAPTSSSMEVKLSLSASEDSSDNRRSLDTVLSASRSCSSSIALSCVLSSSISLTFPGSWSFSCSVSISTPFPLSISISFSASALPPLEGSAAKPTLANEGGRSCSSSICLSCVLSSLISITFPGSCSFCCSVSPSTSFPSSISISFSTSALPPLEGNAVEPTLANEGGHSCSASFSTSLSSGPPPALGPVTPDSGDGDAAGTGESACSSSGRGSPAPSSSASADTSRAAAASASKQEDAEERLSMAMSLMSAGAVLSRGGGRNMGNSSCASSLPDCAMGSSLKMAATGGMTSWSAMPVSAR